MKYSALLLGIFFSVACCCSAEGALDSLFYWLTSRAPLTAAEFTSAMQGKETQLPSEIENFQGVRTDFPGFTNYYLRYNANKSFVLEWVASMPVLPSYETISNEECVSSRESDVAGYFSPPGNDLSDVDFWQYAGVEEKEYYACLRFPWQHSLLFDKNSNTVYHVVSYVRE